MTIENKPGPVVAARWAWFDASVMKYLTKLDVDISLTGAGGFVAAGIVISYT
jgi:hypothetical protein